MNNLIDFMKRHSTWLGLGLLAMMLLSPGIAELKTIFLITAIEALAIALSGVAVYVFTKIDFTKDTLTTNPGIIFLGVHICVGMVVLGVYLAQFAN